MPVAQPRHHSWRFLVLSLLATALTIQTGGCASPTLDGTAWKCDDQSECVAGYVCDKLVGGVCKPAYSNQNGVLPNEIVVGASMDLGQGPLAEVGEAVKAGIKTYLNRINTLGGAHGRSVTHHARDDDYDPDKALTNVTEMVDGANRQVLAILGNTGSPTTARIVPELATRRIPLVGSVTGLSALHQNYRYTFNFRASHADQTAAIVDFYTHNHPVKNIPHRNVVVAAQGTDDSHSVETLDEFGRDGFNGVLTALRQHVDLARRDLGLASVKRASTNVDAAVTQVLKWLADDARVRSEDDATVEALCVVQLVENAGAALVEAIRDALAQAQEAPAGENPLSERGLSLTETMALKQVQRLHFAFTLADMGLPQRLGKNLERYCRDVTLFAAVPNVNSGLSGVVAYRDDLAQFDASLKPSFFSLEGYLLTRLFMAAVEAVGRDITTEQFVDVFGQMGQIDLGIGVFASIDGTNHTALHTVWLQRVQSDDQGTCTYQQEDL